MAYGLDVTVTYGEGTSRFGCLDFSVDNAYVLVNLYRCTSTCAGIRVSLQETALHVIFMSWHS